MLEDNDLDERHLNDISENMARSTDALYGSMSGSRVGSLVMPKRWARNGSDVLCISTNKALEASLVKVSNCPLSAVDIEVILQRQQACGYTSPLYDAGKADIDSGGL